MTDRADQALQAAIELLESRKAERLVTIDLRGRTSLCDFFVICHGSSERQIKSLAEGVEGAVRDATGLRPRVEGRNSSDWILLDFGDFIVHIFSEEGRDFFRLESLWHDSYEEGASPEASDKPAAE